MGVRRKIYSFNSELHLVTGVQKVLLDIHSAVKEDYEARIVGLKSFASVNKSLDIIEKEYIQWKNPFMFYNSFVILHERKFLMLFWILNHVFFQRIKLVYIHHSMLYGHKRMTILPSTIVCISDKGRENLMQEFGAPSKCIHKIHNCVTNRFSEIHPPMHSDTIQILFPALITPVKRQVEIVKRLKGQLNDNVKILFAGVGPLYEQLQTEIKGDKHFECLGFVKDVPSLMRECDYVMLFSKHEGLSISLIEATMTSTPIICNDVGGNTEICYDGKNGFVVNDWEKLAKILNTLPYIDEKKYHLMCQESHAIYKQNYTFDKFKERWLSLLSNLK